MRYSEPKFRKYVQGYGFCQKAWRQMWQKINRYSKKDRMDAAKTASKRVVQNTAETTGYLIGNKIADQITSVDKAKEKTNKPEEIYIPSEKRQQIINGLKLF